MQRSLCTDISVIIPVYDRPDVAKDAIESVLRQTQRPIKIIVVDDGSHQPLSSSLQPYITLITLITLPENTGVSNARNIGVNVADTKYIAFLDSDDLWLCNKIAVQLDYMIKHKLKVSHTNEYWLKKDRWINQGKQHQKYGGDILCKVLDKCRISPSSLVIDKELFHAVGGFDPTLRVCEDYALMLKIASMTEVGYIEQKLVVKRAIAKNSLSAGIKHIESIRLEILERLVAENRLNKHQQACVNEELIRKKQIVQLGLKPHS